MLKKIRLVHERYKEAHKDRLYKPLVDCFTNLIKVDPTEVQDVTNAKTVFV